MYIILAFLIAECCSFFVTSFSQQ